MRLDVQKREDKKKETSKSKSDKRYQTIHKRRTINGGGGECLSQYLDKAKLSKSKELFIFPNDQTSYLFLTRLIGIKGSR